MECYKSKTGSSIYYYEGKRISKEKAKLIYGKKLPKCMSKTNQNVIASLKRQLKEVLSHREGIKGVNEELTSKLKACSIVKGEYDNLIGLINSSKNMVDVMDRVCLTQDLKKELDKEYRELKDSLEVKSKNYEKIERLYESTIENVRVLSEKLREQEEEHKMLEGKYNSLDDDLYESKEINKELSTAVSKLESEFNKLKELLEVEREKTEQAYKVIVTNKVNADRYETEINTLQDENKLLRESVDVLQTNISSLEGEYNSLGDMMVKLREDYDLLYNKNLELEEGKYVMIQEISDIDKALADAVNKYTDDINALEEENNVLRERLEEQGDLCEKDKDNLNELIRQFTVKAKELQRDLLNEKEECLIRVDKAIENEREMTSREARGYEKEISDLNYKLLMTEEALEELNKAKLSTGKRQEKSVKKAAKKIKKAEKP